MPGRRAAPYDRAQTDRPAAGLALGVLLLLGLVPSAAAGRRGRTSRPRIRATTTTPRWSAEIMADRGGLPGPREDLVDRQELQGPRHLDRRGHRTTSAWTTPEPEVLIDALHHAREHLTTEQALYLLKILTTPYATDSVVHRLVDSRRDLDHLRGQPRRDAVRPDRQPVPRVAQEPPAEQRDRPRSEPTSTATTTTTGAAATARRPRHARSPTAAREPFSAPETQAIRDFVASRVIDGRQQIRIHITLHTNGELILWPYGHTKTNIPADMTRADHAAFVALGRADGPPQRLQGRAVERPVHHRRRPDRLDVRHATGSSRSPGSSTRPSTTGCPTSTRPTRGSPAPCRTTARRCSTRSTRRTARTSTIAARTVCGPLVRRLRDQPRLGAQSRRDRHGDRRRSWQIGNPAAVSVDGAKQLGTTVSGRYALVTGLAGASGSERQRPRRRDDHDPLGAGDAAGHDRRAHLPLLLRP